MKLGSYILRRLLLAIPVIVGVTLLTFGISWTANEGDLSRAYISDKTTAEQKQQIVEQYGFDKPWHVQYILYLKRLATIDLGFSQSAGNRPVLEVYKEFMPATLELTLTAMVIAVLAGVALGTLTAVRKDSGIDHFARFLALSGVSIPIFWLGILLKFALATSYPEDLFTTKGALWASIFLLPVFLVPLLLGLAIADGLRPREPTRGELVPRALGLLGTLAILLLIRLLAQIGVWPLGPLFVLQAAPLLVTAVAIAALLGGAWMLVPSRPRLAAILASAAAAALLVGILFGLDWDLYGWTILAIAAIAYAAGIALALRGALRVPRLAWLVGTAVAAVAAVVLATLPVGTTFIHGVFELTPDLPLTGRFSNSLVQNVGEHPSLTDGPTRMLLIDTILARDWVAFNDAVQHLILPGITLGYASLAIIARMMRASMLEVLALDFVRTARAKGLRERDVVRVHARRNALIPIATVVGLTFGGLLSGAVLTETIFAWPGLGRWSTGAIFSGDVNSVMNFTLLVVLIYLVANFLVDILYSVLDPRVRIG